MRNLIKRTFRSDERDQNADGERFARINGELMSTIKDIQKEYRGLNARIRLVSSRMNEAELWQRDVSTGASANETEVQSSVDQKTELARSVARSRMLYGQLQWMSKLSGQLSQARERNIF